MDKTYTVTLADEYTVGGKIGVPVTIDGNHTVWIHTGIELTPYIEPDFDAIHKEAYEQGYNRGTHDAKKVFEGHADEAYQKGLDEAWNAARKLLLLEREGGLSTFGGLHCREVVSQYSASTVINCIRKYEQEEEKLHVGDEVEWVDEKYVVTYIDSENKTADMIHTKDGSVVEEVYYENCRKTGRHFSEIIKALEKMRE